ATPVRTSSYSFKSDALLSNRHIAVFEYTQDHQRAINAGLQSGFDLPERAYTSSSRDWTGTFRLTSTLSGRLLNEFRALGSRRHALDQAESTDPEVLVLEGFTSGGNQENLFRDIRTSGLSVTNISTFTSGGHTARAGFEIAYTSVDQIDRSNFNGTFTFGSDV